MVQKFQTCLPRVIYKTKPNIFSFMPPQQAPLSVCVSANQRTVKSVSCFVILNMHFFIHSEHCIDLIMWIFLLIFTFIDSKYEHLHRSSSVLHIILICNGHRGSTLPPTSADSLSELISEVERTQYHCNVCMVLWGGTLPYRCIKADLSHLGGFQNIFSRRSVLKPDGCKIIYVLLLFAVLMGFFCWSWSVRGMRKAFTERPAMQILFTIFPIWNTCGCEKSLAVSVFNSSQLCFVGMIYGLRPAASYEVIVWNKQRSSDPAESRLNSHWWIMSLKRLSVNLKADVSLKQSGCNRVMFVCCNFVYCRVRCSGVWTPPHRITAGGAAAWPFPHRYITHQLVKLSAFQQSSWWTARLRSQSQLPSAELSLSCLFNGLQSEHNYQPRLHHHIWKKRSQRRFH